MTVAQPSDAAATTPPPPIDTDFLESCHDLLLRLAGRLADDLICQARRWLADGHIVDLLRAVSFAVVARRVPIFDEELGFLTEALALYGESTTSLAEVAPADVDPGIPFAFLPLPPDVADRLDSAGEHVPECLDHTTVRECHDGTLDAIDAEAAAIADGQAGVLGLWRSWRVPAQESPWPPPKRVYLLEVSSRRIRQAMTDRMVRTLAGAGESDPLVEVWATGDAVSEYQILACSGGALLWAAAPRREIHLAPILDGPVQSYLPRLTDDIERQGVLEYLDSGVVLLTTDLLGEDLIEPRGALVPTDIRTDGTWIWADATAYYLRHYRIAPDAGLLAHIRAARYRPAQPDGVALFRAMAMLAQADSTPR
jgi:hypothetical protein